MPHGQMNELLISNLRKPLQLVSNTHSLNAGAVGFGHELAETLRRAQQNSIHLSQSAWRRSTESQLPKEPRHKKVHLLAPKD